MRAEFEGVRGKVSECVRERAKLHAISMFLMLGGCGGGVVRFWAVF